MTTVHGNFDDVAISPFMRAVVKSPRNVKRYFKDPSHIKFDALDKTQLRDLVASAPSLHASRCTNERHIGLPQCYRSMS